MIVPQRPLQCKMVKDSFRLGCEFEHSKSERKSNGVAAKESFYGFLPKQLIHAIFKEFPLTVQLHNNRVCLSISLGYSDKSVTIKNVCQWRSSG